MSRPLLNRRLILEEPSRVADGAGGFATAWIALGVVWGGFAPGPADEREAGSAAIAATAWRITLRAAPFGAASRPKPGQRLREGARVFRILAVAEADAAGRWLTCHAREEVTP